MRFSRTVLLTVLAAAGPWAPAQVTILNPCPTLSTEQIHIFSAGGASTTQPDWVWRVVEPGGGSIVRDAQGRGVYTPPAFVSGPETVHIQVRNGSDPTDWASTTVQVSNGPLFDKVMPGVWGADWCEPQMTLLAGHEEDRGVQDGPGPEARFQDAGGLACLSHHPDPELRGKLLVADLGGRLCMVAADGAVKTWITLPASMPKLGVESFRVTTAGGTVEVEVPVPEAGSEADRFEPSYLAVRPFSEAAGWEWQAVVTRRGIPRPAWDAKGEVSWQETPMLFLIDAKGGATGLGSYGQQCQDGPVAQAKFFCPRGVAMAQDGTIYVADHKAIRRIAKGEVSTLAGGREKRGVSGPAEQPFTDLRGLALDHGTGELYVCDENAVRCVAPDGTVTTVVGKIEKPGSEEWLNLATTKSRIRFRNFPCLNQPRGLTIAHGQLFIADEYGSTIRVWDLGAPWGLTTLAGIPNSRYADGRDLEIMPASGTTRFGRLSHREDLPLEHTAIPGRPFQVALDDEGHCWVSTPSCVAELSLARQRLFAPGASGETVSAQNRGDAKAND